MITGGRTIKRVPRWSANEPVAHGKLNAIVDAINALTATAPSMNQHTREARHIWRFAVVRGYSSDESHILQVTFIASNEDMLWIIPEDKKEPVFCEPNMQASHYEQFVCGLEDMVFPHTIEIGEDVRPIPVIRTHGRQVALHRMPLYTPDPLPENMHHTDCYLTEGDGEVIWE